MIRARLVFVMFATIFAFSFVYPSKQQNARFYNSSSALVLDLYTNHGGQGINGSGGSFYPSDTVVLCANLTYNGDCVMDALVSFEVKNPFGVSIVYSTARTDEDGIAEISFVISGQASLEEVLGAWTAKGTVSVAQIFAGDMVVFHIIEDPPILLLGDINLDGKVDVRDVAFICMAWKSKIGDSNYNLKCDLNEDGGIDIVDATILAMNWGKTVF